MNIDATEEDLAAIGETLKLAAILDDRAPKADKARIIAWAEQIHRHNLKRDDLLNGLQAFYDGPSDRAIQIGDLIHHAKYARRGRIEREQQAEQEARWARNDEKAGYRTPDPDEMRRLSAAFIGGRVAATPRLKAACDALDSCYGKDQAQAAITEFFAAKLDSKKNPPKKVSQ